MTLAVSAELISLTISIKPQEARETRALVFTPPVFFLNSLSKPRIAPKIAAIMSLSNMMGGLGYGVRICHYKPLPDGAEKNN